MAVNTGYRPVNTETATSIATSIVDLGTINANEQIVLSDTMA